MRPVQLDIGFVAFLLHPYLQGVSEQRLANQHAMPILLTGQFGPRIKLGHSNAKNYFR